MRGELNFTVVDIDAAAFRIVVGVITQETGIDLNFAVDEVYTAVFYAVAFTLVSRSPQISRGCRTMLKHHSA